MYVVSGPFLWSRLPWCENEPKLLAAGSMRTPAVRILLLILIGENRLERSPVQVELHHIGRGERARRQGRVDHLATRCADLRRGLGRRMRSDDDPCAWSCWGQQEIRAVKERATGSRGADGSSAGQVAR